MIQHLYTVCWNEADILPFFFRHYDPWIDRYVIFDNGSTDASLDILRSHPRVELRAFPWRHADSFILSMQAMQNEVWKQSRGGADWVIVTAIDEHLCVPGTDMKQHLADSARRGITLIPALGYQMVSEEFPAPEETLCQSRTRGAPWQQMNKLSIFSPNRVQETNFAPGRHQAKPQGALRYPRRDRLLLLHYKFIGFERSFAHQVRQIYGLRAGDHARDWGHQYTESRDKLRQTWDRFAAQAVDVSSPKLRPWATHLEKRWWRSQLFNWLLRQKSQLRRAGYLPTVGALSTTNREREDSTGRLPASSKNRS